MRRLPDINGDDWIPEDDESEEEGSFSEDYDYRADDFDRQYEEFYR